MKKVLGKISLLFALAACGSIAYAQLPNEKFGKPSNLEWEYKGWGDAIDADAIILCKTMKVNIRTHRPIRFYDRKCHRTECG